ncbi:MULTISPECIES: MFS transporter [unclassified Arthrobacter]|uniref:MFS transporter n=1 Tax=unclassified Arthrobacter TaxID=235627 RepID=UPI001C614A54|nr:MULTISPECIES: MFS transporter [unclassified Arthrobacter]
MSKQQINMLQTPASVVAQRRAVLAGSFGNLLEQYDNLVYAYSASLLAVLFFPTAEGITGILATFAVFAVGFLARPAGTLIFGHIGDKVGRKQALIVSVGLMGAATLLIGCLPTYNSIGAWAPALLVAVRLIQGAAVAGEWAGSAAMLVEYAPPHRRGFFGSFNQVTTAAGFLLASAVVALNSLFFDQQELIDFGWRVPFLIGVLTAGVAVFLRFGLADTPSFQAEKDAGQTADKPLRIAFTTQKLAIAKGFGFTVGWTVAYFFFLTYIPTYLTTVAGVSPNVAKSSNLVSLAVMVLAIAGFGALSDRIGRKPLLLIGSGGFVVLSYPILLMFGTGNDFLVYLAQIVVAVILAAFSGPGPAALSELFPTRVRYSSLGIGYNFSVMLFGGTAAFFATGLVTATGVPEMVALLPMAAALVTLLVVLRMPETFRTPLR